MRGADAAGSWTYVDRVLAVAATLAESLRCPGCGQPRHESWNPDSEGWYEGHEANCHGCAELERMRKSDDGDYDPAAKRWVVDTRPPDQPLREWNPLG